MKTITLSVSQFNTFVKQILDAEEFLSNICIFGEVTNFKMSGNNAYFDLKDEGALVSCVKFGVSDLTIKNGDLVTAFGKVNFYVKSGRLNFIVGRVVSAGMGDLYQRFLLLKDKLEKEGLFREEIKKEIPKYAKNIGVVTSEKGAVIRDIINVTRTKNPYTNIIVYPAKVQGVGAEDEIARGIEYFNNREDIDTIIIARGGGSIEDLSPFNTEKIVRSIYLSDKPIISAVGHETDFTLCDFASDLRVPTPSVAAEVAVFDYYQQIQRINQTNQNIFNFINVNLSLKRKDVYSTEDSIIDKTKLVLESTKSNIMMICNKIQSQVGLIFKEKQNQLDRISVTISKLNPIEILKNGYVVAEKNNQKIQTIKDLSLGDEITIHMFDGKIKANVTNIEE